jgi:hypothetical protein
MKGKFKRPITCRGGFFYADKIQQAKEIGSFAVVVDPIDREAELFYGKYDFIKLPDSEKMFIAIRTLKELFD